MIILSRENLTSRPIKDLFLLSTPRPRFSSQMCCKPRSINATLSHSYKASSSSVEYDSTCVSFSNGWQSTEVSTAFLSLYFLLCVLLWVAVNGILCFICVFSCTMIIPHTSTSSLSKNGGLWRFRWACRSFERQRTRAMLACFKIHVGVWTVLNVQDWDYFVRFLLGRKFILMSLLCFLQFMARAAGVNNINATADKPTWTLESTTHISVVNASKSFCAECFSVCLRCFVCSFTVCTQTFFSNNI